MDENSALANPLKKPIEGKQHKSNWRHPFNPAARRTPGPDDAGPTGRCAVRSSSPLRFNLWSCTKACLFRCGNLRQNRRVGMGKSIMLRFFLILFAVVISSSPLHAQMARPVPRGGDLARPLFVQEPYCVMGYGSCGGACNEEGKKPWDCPAESLPCYESSQHCTCEEADICKPKKKRKTELSHPPVPSPAVSLLAAQGTDQAAR